MSLSLDQVEKAIRNSWAADTCWDADEFDPATPAALQCGATTLVINDHFGGDVLEAKVYRDGVHTEYHYWNRLPSGEEFDLTREQFRSGEVIGEPVVKRRNGPLPDKERQAQYEILRDRVLSQLESASS